MNVRRWSNSDLLPVIHNLVKLICRLRDEYAYGGGPFDVTAMRAMRERQVRHLVTGGTFNAKYSPGGLVDVEYLIQGLQINHGANNSNPASDQYPPGDGIIV